MAEPWFREYNLSYLKTPGQNDAGNYGVYSDAVEGAEFEMIGVHHLDQSENRGKNHIWLEVLDETGQRIQGATVGFNWEGHAESKLVTLDKPAKEPGANIPLWAGQVVTCWVHTAAGKAVVSDRVGGMHTAHPDEPPGNTRFHHSFYVAFQRRKTAPPAEPEQPPQSPGEAQRLREVIVAAIRVLEAGLN